jgi:hypothetical protein
MIHKKMLLIQADRAFGSFTDRFSVVYYIFIFIIVVSVLLCI